MAGRLIVVGGHSRHVGKTASVAAILRCLAPSAWTAVKISAHKHGAGAASVEERDGNSGSQTARYLQAGASRAFLLRAPDEKVRDAAERIAWMRGAGQSVIAESNRLVEHCRPDLTLFVVAPSIRDWKPSSAACLRRAGALLILGEADLPPEAVAVGGERVRTLPLFRLQPGGEPPRQLRAWLRRRLDDQCSNTAGPNELSISALHCPSTSRRNTDVAVSCQENPSPFASVPA